MLTPLHYAAKNNQVPAIQALLKNKDVDINAKDIQQRTPLYLACKYNCFKAVKCLVENGADVNIIPDNMISLIILSIINKNFEVFEYLINISNINKFVINPNGWNPIHYASQLGQANILESFYEINKDMFKMKDNYGRTPLHIAAQWNQIDSVIFYHEKGIDIFEEKDNDGNTPLHLAVKWGNAEIFEYIQEYTNMNLNIQNKKVILINLAFIFYFSNSPPYCNRNLVTSIDIRSCF